MYRNLRLYNEEKVKGLKEKALGIAVVKKCFTD